MFKKLMLLSVVMLMGSDASAVAECILNGDCYSNPPSYYGNKLNICCHGTCESTKDPSFNNENC